MISEITAKNDGSFVVQFQGLPYHATEAETPEVFALVQAAILDGAVVKPFVVPELTAEQQREEWKMARAQAIARIKVTVNGRVFDGDETSQDRMVRAILGLQTQPGTVRWVLANNDVAEVTLSELQEALALASAQQTALWAPV